jgi:outer membrane immunogenic protein
VRKICTAAAAASAVMLPLLPGVQAQEWSGFYLGANLGAAWGNSDAKAQVICPTNAAIAYFCSTTAGQNNGPAVTRQGTGTFGTEQVTGGVQAGYNVQSGSFVYGFEMDLDALDLSTSRQGRGDYPTPFGAGVAGNTFTIGSSFGTNWLYTARGRVGWSLSNVLIFATGGLAVTDLKVTTTFRDNLALVGFAPGASLSVSNEETRAGWTVGGGAEWALTDHWIVKGEYLYVDFGSVSASGNIANRDFPGGINPLSISQDISAHIARVGVNYGFDLGQ